MAISRLHRIPRAVTKEQGRRFADELAASLEALTQVEEAAPLTEIKPALNPVDWAISEIDLERELELLSEARGESQEVDEILNSMPSSESICDLVESARQKISS
jgi:hypothetical protein